MVLSKPSACTVHSRAFPGVDRPMIIPQISILHSHWRVCLNSHQPSARCMDSRLPSEDGVTYTMECDEDDEVLAKEVHRPIRFNAEPGTACPPPSAAFHRLTAELKQLS
eukprot:EG_transcript_53548